MHPGLPDATGELHGAVTGRGAAPQGVESSGHTDVPGEAPPTQPSGSNLSFAAHYQCSLRRHLTFSTLVSHVHNGLVTPIATPPGVAVKPEMGSYTRCT